MPIGDYELLEISSEKGASRWLTALHVPMHKGAFRDALCLRYEWRPPLLFIQHGTIDLTAQFLTETCLSVGIESPP